MDIRSWPKDKIMQLPECAFGRRWLVGVYFAETAVDIYYDISEAGLGDMCVVWQVSIAQGGGPNSLTNVALALGDVLPTNDAQFDVLQPVFSDLGRRALARRAVDVGIGGTVLALPTRTLIHAQGRRLVGRVELTVAEITMVQAILTISSIPTEVPDWMISGQVNYR